MNRIGVFNRQFGLGSIAEDLGVEFTPHRAADDAYATMKIAEAMCREEGLTFNRLLEKYEIRTGRIENYEVRQNESRAHAAYVEEAQKKKEERERARVEFHNYIDREKRRRRKEGILKNKTVCFSHPLEETLSASKPLAAALFAEGGFYGFRAEECDYYVYFEGESGPRIKSGGRARREAAHRSRVCAIDGTGVFTRLKAEGESRLYFSCRKKLSPSCLGKCVALSFGG